MPFLGDLVMRLKLDSADFSAEMNRTASAAERSFKQIKTAAELVIGALSIDAFADMIKSSADFQDQLWEMNKVTGISVTSLDQMRQTAQLAGTDFGDVSTAMQRLSRSLSSGSQETSTAAGALKFLGLSAKELMGIPLDEAMRIIAERLAKYADGAGKVALMQDLMGRGAASLLPYMRELADAGERNSVVTNDSAEKAHSFEVALRGLEIQVQATKVALGNELIPTITKYLSIAAAELQAGGISAFFNISGRDAEQPLIAIRKIQDQLAYLKANRDNMSEHHPWFNADDIAIANEQIRVMSIKLQQLQNFAQIKISMIDTSGPASQMDARDLMVHGPKPQAAYNRGDPKEAAAEIKLFTSTLQGLEKEYFNLNQSGDIAKISWETQSGSLKKLTQAHKDQLMAQAALNDIYRASIAYTKEISTLYDGIRSQSDDILIKTNDESRAIDFKNSLIGKGSDEQAKLNAQQQIYLDLLQQLAKIPRDELGDPIGAQGRKLQEDAMAAAEKRKRLAVTGIDLGAVKDVAYKGVLQGAENQFQSSLIGKTQREVEQLTLARKHDIEIMNQFGTTQDDVSNKALHDAIMLRDADVEALKKRQEAQRDWANGAKVALQDYAETATNMAANVNTLFTNSFQSMENALVDFVKNGKLDFKSLADSIISDIIRVYIRAKVLGPLAKFLAGTPGGGTSAPEEVKQLADIGNFASGTDYVPYDMVAQIHQGEKIIPASENMGGGGGTPDVTVNITNKGAPVQAQAAPMRFDGKNWVLDVVLTAMRENASVRDNMRAALGTPQ